MECPDADGSLAMYVTTRTGHAPATLDRPLTVEVVARLEQALRARPLEDLPSGYAKPVYEVLVSHGFDRGDLLALAASLVDLVASDVISDAQ